MPASRGCLKDKLRCSVSASASSILTHHANGDSVSRLWSRLRSCGDTVPPTGLVGNSWSHCFLGLQGPALLSIICSWCRRSRILEGQRNKSEGFPADSYLPTGPQGAGLQALPLAAAVTAAAAAEAEATAEATTEAAAGQAAPPPQW